MLKRKPDPTRKSPYITPHAAGRTPEPDDEPEQIPTGIRALINEFDSAMERIKSIAPSNFQRTSNGRSVEAERSRRRKGARLNPKPSIEKVRTKLEQEKP